MHPADLEALADLVAERLAQRLGSQTSPTPQLVDAQAVADALGLTRATVYERAEALGGVRIGDGVRPRWRFDLEDAISRWTARRAVGQSQPLEPVRTLPKRRRAATREPSGARLLPFHRDDA
jgi:hypothetical protein